MVHQLRISFLISVLCFSVHALNGAAAAAGAGAKAQQSVCIVPAAYDAKFGWSLLLAQPAEGRFLSSFNGTVPVINPQSLDKILSALTSNQYSDVFQKTPENRIYKAPYIGLTLFVVPVKFISAGRVLYHLAHKAGISDYYWLPVSRILKEDTQNIINPAPTQTPCNPQLLDFIKKNWLNIQARLTGKFEDKKVDALPADKARAVIVDAVNTIASKESNDEKFLVLKKLIPYLQQHHKDALNDALWHIFEKNDAIIESIILNLLQFLSSGNKEEDEYSINLLRAISQDQRFIKIFNAFNLYGNPAIAWLLKNPQMLSITLKAGANPNISYVHNDGTKMPALARAIKDKNVQAVKLLLESPLLDLNQQADKAFEFAKALPESSEKTEILKLLAAHGVGVVAAPGGAAVPFE